MRITPEILEKQWNSIKYTNGGFLQIDTKHPLEWHSGYQSISQRTLLLVSDTEIFAIESSKSMAVSRRRRESDNRWTLSFELLRDEQQSVFAILCCDIIENSRSAISEEDALRLVVNRYKQWSKLLETQRNGLMDEHCRKGLLGELLFLEQRLALTGSKFSCVQGWVGADGADQDFVYSDGWFEIKSISVSADNVSISSLEQLDCDNNGELVINRIDKVAFEKEGAYSLNDVVNRICNLLVDDAVAIDLFRTKLAQYGYMDLHEYSEQKYLCFETQHYIVNESFPKLTKKTVPIQISSLKYELDLPSLADWLKE